MQRSPIIIITPILCLVALAFVAVNVLPNLSDQQSQPPAQILPTPPPTLTEKPTPQPEPESDPTPTEPAEKPPHIRSIPINGQDIADLHNHRMWKFAFKLPPNEYTNYIWLEKWSRDATEPTVELLSTIYDVWDENDLVIKLSSLAFPQQYARIGAIEVRDNAAAALIIDEPYRTEILSGPSPLTPNENISLIAFTHNQNSSPTGGLEDVHRDHDITIYIKTRFQSGPYQDFTRLPKTKDSPQVSETIPTPESPTEN